MAPFSTRRKPVYTPYITFSPQNQPAKHHSVYMRYFPQKNPMKKNSATHGSRTDLGK